MVKPISLKLPNEILRDVVANLERTNARSGFDPAAMVDGIAEGVAQVLNERLGPIERRLSELERRR